MNPRTLTVLSMLLDLKAAAMGLLEKKHRNPALLNLYTFMDICASLSNQGEDKNRKIFENYIERFSSLISRDRYTSYDLWAARSSLLHAYSPFGHHTRKKNEGAQPIFYYSWPENKEEVEAALRSRGHDGFLLIDINEIKWTAVDAFNELYRRVECDSEFEALFLTNAENILPSLFYMRLEDELTAIQKFVDSAKGEGRQ